MKTQVKQWGNSAVVRIPKPLLEDAGLAVDSPIEIKIVDGRLVVEPLKEGQYSLDTLLAGGPQIRHPLQGVPWTKLDDWPQRIVVALNCRFGADLSRRAAQKRIFKWL